MTESSDLQEICRSVLPAVSDSFRGKEIRAEFYPYIGMTHTIRRRGSVWVIRICDHCNQAPRPVLEAVVRLLACKVLRRKPPTEALRIFEDYRRDPEIERKVHLRRLERGRKQIDERCGKHHALAEIFLDLNQKFFNHQLELRRLGWGVRRSWSRLGHYDPIHHSITISPVLDSPRVPRLAISYLLYHEMLHVLFNDAGNTGRHHTPEFNRAERAFPSYVEARRLLNRFCRTRGRTE